MRSINFDTGYREYALNNDENNTVRINISDINIAKRAEEIQTFFNELAEKYKDDNRKLTHDELAEYDRILREKMNYTFGTDVCTAAFGNVNCLSETENGESLFQVFFESLIKTIEEDKKATAQAKAVHLENKTNDYITRAQSTPVAPQISVNANPEPDISALTTEQKDAMLLELMRQKK